MRCFPRLRRRRDAPKASQEVTSTAPPPQEIIHKQPSPVSSPANPSIEPSGSAQVPIDKTDSGSKQPASRALKKAIDNHIALLPDAEKARFSAAGESITDEDLMHRVKEYNTNHEETSRFRKHTGKLETTFGALNSFMTVVVAAAAANAEATIAVGAVKVVLDLALNFIGFFSKFTTLLNRLADYLVILADFARSSPLADETLVKDCIAAGYGQLMLFCHKGHSVFYDEDKGSPRSMTTFRVFWRVQWRPFESDFGEIEANMQHQIRRLNLVLPGISAAAIKEVRTHQQAQEKEGLLRWLSDWSYEERHEDKVLRKHPGTGGWLFDKDEFRTWFDSTKSSLLWCNGAPGVGKSFLAANVVEYVSARRGLEDGVGIAFLYYDHQYSSQQDLSHTIRAMLKQLCRDHKSVPEHLSMLKQRALPVGRHDFMTVANGYNELFIIVDALDECSTDSRPDILGYLYEILQSLPNAHVCVLSRPENDITRSLERADTLVIRLQASDLAPDIKAYVEDEVSNLRAGRNGIQLFLKSEQLASDVVRTLTEQASGMFLWVRLQLQDLCRISESRKDTEVRKALARLPTGLDTTYLRILEQINRKPDYIKSLAIRALQHVIYSQRVLRLEELQFALAEIGHDQNGKDLELDKESVILEACSNLLTVETQDSGSREARSFVRPTHFSVQQFLEGRNASTDTTHPLLRPFDKEEVHGILAETCISHLLQPLMHLKGFAPIGRPGYWLSQDPCLLYAASFFDKHVLLSGPNLTDTLETSIDRLLRSELDLLLNILIIQSFRDMTASSRRSVNMFSRRDMISFERKKQIYEDFSKKFSTGVNATAFVDATLLGQRADIINRIDNRQTLPQALLYACWSCLEPELPVLRLLGKGVDINVRGYQGCTALGIAFWDGSQKLIKLLLENHANVNARDEHGDTALQHSIADAEMDPGLVRLLLDKGAEVNAANGPMAHALQLASTKSLDVCKLLIERGANVNAHHDRYLDTALVAASYYGHVDIAQFLLEQGADVNDYVKESRYGNALHASLLQAPKKNDMSQIQMINLLLDYGVDINAVSGPHGSALQAAAHDGHHDAIELLIERGADVHAIGGLDGNALNAACRNGYVGTVQMMLDYGADANTLIPNPRHIDPMDWSSGSSSPTYNQDVHPKGFTALDAALTDSDHFQVVALLLHHGAAIDSQILTLAVFEDRWKSLAVILRHECCPRLKTTELKMAVEAAEKSLDVGQSVTLLQRDKRKESLQKEYLQDIRTVIVLLQQRLEEVDA